MKKLCIETCSCVKSETIALLDEGLSIFIKELIKYAKKKLKSAKVHFYLKTNIEVN